MQERTPSALEARRGSLFAPPRVWLARARAAISAEIRAIDAEASSERAAQSAPDRGPLVGFIGGALCLTLMEYLAGPRALYGFLRLLHGVWPALPDPVDLRFSRWYGLLDLGFWVATRALGFVVVPLLLARLFLKQDVSDYGVRRLQRFGDLKPYLALFLAVLPLVLAVSTRPEFHTYYPFYRRAAESWVDFGVWEALYAFQFVCVEFFFRGFLLGTLRRSLGSLAVLAAMLPYCMVHFTKPVLEVLGAIPAGLVLGLLALRARSIWGGVLLHVSVAWSMDVLAILQTTGFPTRLFPD